MKTIRIGIIGVGQIGKAHLDVYKTIRGVEIVAACGRSRENLENVALKYGVPHIYQDFRELLKRDDLDAVDVCLHNNLHAPVAIAALEAGKHVYCEKPIAGSYHDGATMLNAAERSGRMLHIQLAGLFSNETRAAKQLIDAGALGDVYHARSVGFRRRGRPYVDGYGSASFVQKEISGGGALFDMGIYHISPLLYLMDMPKPVRISGKIYQKTGMYVDRREKGGYNVEELGLGFVRFENDVTMDIFESWAVHMDKMDCSAIMGTKGGIKLEPFSYHTTQGDMELDCKGNLAEMNIRRQCTGNNADLYSTMFADTSNYQAPPLVHWVAALRNEVKLLPTAQIALGAMLLQEGIYLSDALGREMTAEEVIITSKSTALEV